MTNQPVLTSFCPFRGRWADSSSPVGGAEVKRKAEMTANEPKESEFESKALQEGEESIGQEAEILMPLCTFFNPTA